LVLPFLPTSRSLPFCTRKTKMKCKSLPTLFLLTALIADAHCLMRNPFYATLRPFLPHALCSSRLKSRNSCRVGKSEIQMSKLSFLRQLNVERGARRDAGLRLGNGGLFSSHFESLHSFSCLVSQPKLLVSRSRCCLRCMTLWLFFVTLL
jgi:hypothetical protein